MNKASIYHRVDSEFCYSTSEDSLTLRLRCEKNTLTSASVFTGNRVYPEEEVPVTEHKMYKVCTGTLFDYWEASFKVPYHRVFYYFKISDQSETLYYYQDEFYSKPETNRTYFYQVPYIRREEIYRVPQWAQNSIMYQIFPDSFATGRMSHSGREAAVAAIDTKEHFPKQKCIEEGGLTYTSVYGGTLKGVIENVPYIKSLGVNLVYMNPIFAAYAYHKYDTIDYKKIDPAFGTNEDFKKLVETFHANGIKIILDGVFNHSGRGFFAFQDVLKNQEKSKYKDWYYRLEFPVKDDGSTDYACFAYVKQMPKLNTGNPEVAEYFAEVGRYWIREYDVDGWRLDVANEIDKNFWRIFKKAVREEKSDAFVLGEIWEDARNWLTYDQFDSAMNYRFTYLCQKFFAERTISSFDFAGHFSDYLMRYPECISYAQMNLLDSHDVSRFLSQCKDDVKRYMLAVGLQMTIPGIPSVFAGDELGMNGVHDWEYRVPLDWSRANDDNEVFAWYKKLLQLRKDTDVIRKGKIRFLDSKDKDVLVYQRFDDRECMTFIINNSDSKKCISIEGCKTVEIDANSFVYGKF